MDFFLSFGEKTMEGRIKSYSEFYQFYLTEHKNATSRLLHFIGTGLVIALAVIFTWQQMWSGYWWALLVCGYGFAWAGHFFFEKNKPATFKYPLWSLISDFKMFFQLLTRRISFKA